MREFTFSITLPTGATRAYTHRAGSEREVRAFVARTYPGAIINWIL